MQSPSSSSSHRESWLKCRRALASRVVREPLFHVPMQAIDWALDRGVAERTNASLSLDRLVISDVEGNAMDENMVVVIPKPDRVELRLYRATQLVERVDIERNRLCEHLERLLSHFHRTSNC